MSSAPTNVSQCTALLRASCAKMVESRYQKGGAKLHKNFLVLQTMKHLQNQRARLQEAERAKAVASAAAVARGFQRHQVPVIMDEYDGEPDEFGVNLGPALEYTVTDSDEVSKNNEPLVFGCEAIEEDVETPAPLSPAIDEALARCGTRTYIVCERKRKGELRASALPPRQKSRCVSDRAVPVSRLTPCV